jgi:hypothetical protein
MSIDSYVIWGIIIMGIVGSVLWDVCEDKKLPFPALFQTRSERRWRAVTLLIAAFALLIYLIAEGILERR